MVTGPAQTRCVGCDHAGQCPRSAAETVCDTGLGGATVRRSFIRMREHKVYSIEFAEVRTLPLNPGESFMFCGSQISRSKKIKHDILRKASALVDAELYREGPRGIVVAIDPTAFSKSGSRVEFGHEQ